MHIKQLFLANNIPDNDAIEAVCMSNVEDSTPEGSTYTMIDSLENPNNIDKRILSNIWRIQQASLDGEMFYIDSDAIVKKWPVFSNPSKPYFVRTNMGKVGCYAFYVNGCTSFFSSILPEVLESKSAWTISDILNNHSSEVELFPEDCVDHFCVSNTNKNYLQFGSGRFGLIKREGVWSIM